MAKLKTIELYEKNSVGDTFKIKLDVSVNADGMFTTTLPAEAVNKFNAAGMNFRTNKMGREGYLRSKTLDEILASIRKLMKECMSEKLESEELVISYQIDTICSYCLDEDNEPVPNGSNQWIGNRDCRWQEGTYKPLFHSTPFIISVYAKPFMKQVYRFKSGGTHIKYERYDENSDDAYYLKWLAAIPSIGASERGSSIQEVPYSEDVCKLFVDMIKSIAKINMQIKDFLTPEAIQEVAAKGQNMLSQGNIAT